MNTTSVNGALLAAMIKNGAASLKNKVKEVNDLNVFPIPDGDTGDNMFLTIDAGVVALADEPASVGEAARLAANGMLLGARGNSGVILSRIFAGIARGLEGVDEADVRTFHKAMESGVKESYSAVSVPVEGTILTVYRDAVHYAGTRITVGTSTTTFSPSKKCTRGEIATFIWRACGSPDPKATSMSFNDVESNRFYYKPVLWADESKFFKGVNSIVYTNDSGIAVTDAGWPRSFGPSKNCHRSLVVHMLYKMASYVPDSHNCDYGCSAKNAGYYTIIANGGLFLRDDHNTTTSNKLVLMKEGYKVYVEKATDGFTKVDWAHVKYTDDNGKVWQGYACKKYLQKVNNDGGTQTGDWAWPMKGYYVSGNDWMTKTDRSRPYHLGIDIATKSDSNVYAAGTVVSCDDHYANGNYVIIKHVIGGKTVYSFYAHLSSYVSGLSGKTVAKGDKIGVYGDTGNSSKGAHLHFAIVDTCWSSGGYFGYGPTYTSNDKVSYEGVYYYNPRYVIENNKLP